jgi:hypothetical protein
MLLATSDMNLWEQSFINQLGAREFNLRVGSPFAGSPCNNVM